MVFVYPWPSAQPYVCAVMDDANHTHRLTAASYNII